MAIGNCYALSFFDLMETSASSSPWVVIFFHFYMIRGFRMIDVGRTFLCFRSASARDSFIY